MSSAERPVQWYPSRTRLSSAKADEFGVPFTAFIHNGPNFYLTDIVVYQDEQVWAWGMNDFAAFVQLVQSGWVTTEVPSGATVSVHHLARFVVSEPIVIAPRSEFLKDVRGAIDELNGRPTPMERMNRAIQLLISADTPDHRRRFEDAFAVLPSFRRKYAFDCHLSGATEEAALASAYLAVNRMRERSR